MVCEKPVSFNRQGNRYSDGVAAVNIPMALLMISSRALPLPRHSFNCQFNGLQDPQQVQRSTLLCLDHVIPDGLVFDEEPRLVHQECLEGAEIGWISNLVRGPVQHVEQERLQHFWSIAPSVKVKSLKSSERKRVLGVIEEEAILTSAGPAMQAVFQVANDIGEVGKCSLTGFKQIRALDRKSVV